MNAGFYMDLAVVPILVGPLQVFLAMLPAILFGIGSALVALFKPATFKLALKLLWRMKVSVIIAIAVLSSSVFAARAVWRNATGAVGKTEAGARDWPLFRGNASRTGAVGSGADPMEGGINWAFAGEAKTFHSSPTIVGNRVYVTSAEIGVFSNRGAIYCLDADTGGVVWKSAPEGFRATFSSPSVVGKYLVTGEGLHQTRDGRITCLDVTRGGAVLWSFHTKSHVESSAAIADGRAIIGAGDDGYYCFRLEPDAKGNPVMLWHLSGDQYLDAENSPLVNDGRAYLGLGIGGHAIVCVDVETGRELWRVRTPAPVFAPPMIARGKLFIGMGHGNFVEPEELVIATEIDRLRAAKKSDQEIEEAKTHLQAGGEAWCIDLATQKVEWRFKTDSTLLGPIVAGEDRLFFASRGGTVYSAGFDGKPLALWNARATVIASLAVTSSHVYTVTETGRLFALEQTSLRPVWETRLGARVSFLSSPAIARGHVYVGSPEDGLLCVGHPAGQTTERIWAGSLGGAGAGGNPEGATLPAQGEVLSRWPGAESDAITAPAAVMGNRLFVPLNGPARHGVVCLRANGAPHEPLAEQWFADTPNGVTTSPSAGPSGVAFSDGAPGGAHRRLHFVSGSSGQPLWSAAIEPEADGFECLTADAVIAQVKARSLTSFDLHGRVRWSQPLGRLAGCPVVADSRIIAVTTDGLFVLDELEGTILWRAPLTSTSGTGPIVHGKSIFIGTATGIAAYRLLDGKPLWEAPVGFVETALVQCGASVAATTSRGELIVLDPENGAIQARQAGARPDLPPLPGRDALLFAAVNGVMRFDLADNSVAPWLAIETVTSPLIVVGSSVYFAGGKAGLIRAGEAGR